MTFKDPRHVDMIAPIVLEVLELPTEPADTIGSYRDILLDRICRELEKLVVIGKSKKARENAQRADIPRDLSEYSWAKRSLLDGVHEDGFHFEHTETVYEIKRSLLTLANPTLAEVAAVLSRTRVTWVTKRENERLDELGYKSRRPNWADAYKRAGIELDEGPE
ncbi:MULTISPECIES: hypothetical protein [Bradyrhizobium]|uniref:hypothetical protein n=1 Tax=Bradyrhizobium elkanii TaxID=29448 RepID=UPI00048081A8|nr:hypothetical protein [Bradyrhizobium elkanii]